MKRRKVDKWKEVQEAGSSLRLVASLSLENFSSSPKLFSFLSLLILM